jgi:hemoglobin
VATVYDQVGGTPYFEELVDAFYRHVATEPELLAIYPEPHDLAPARERLTLFLVQYWGGPTTYSDERGHPRLRMRHAPYVVDEAQRDRWMSCMTAAMAEVPPPTAELQQAFEDYFQNAAQHMLNA